MFTGFCVFHFSFEKPGTKYMAEVNAIVVVNTSFNAISILTVKIFLSGRYTTDQTV